LQHPATQVYGQPDLIKNLLPKSANQPLPAQCVALSGEITCFIAS
jgi:hypothetical protein